MHRKYLFVLLIPLLLNGGLSASTRKLSDKWKDKLNKVLDTESEELEILHNLITQSESGSSQANPIKTIMKDVKSSDSLVSLREEGVLTKLKENSKRMDGMAVLMNDLRNVLSDAIKVQSKQMHFENEVVELRQEIDSLRKEIRQLKRDQTYNSKPTKGENFQDIPALEDKTIEWLKDSTTELRNQLNEMFRSCNATAILHIHQNLDQQSKRQREDLLVVQKEIQAIRLQQLQQNEKISETKGDVEDLRCWQTNMGQKLVDGQLILTGGEGDNVIGQEEHVLTQTLKEAGNFLSKYGKRSTRLKALLGEIDKTTKIIAQDHYYMSHRLDTLEKLVQRNQSIRTLAKARTPDISLTTMENRVTGIENTISQYTLTLQNLGNKMNVLNEVHESTTQLFSTLDNLETKYDNKLTEMQTNMAKIEATVSSLDNTKEEVKEQQEYQNGVMQSVKKDLMQMTGQLQKNNFRLASLQSELLKWSSQKCSVEDSESIQDIRIASLESLFDFVKKDSF